MIDIKDYALLATRVYNKAGDNRLGSSEQKQSDRFLEKHGLLKKHGFQAKKLQDFLLVFM